MFNVASCNATFGGVRNAFRSETSRKLCHYQCAFLSPRRGFSCMSSPLLLSPGRFTPLTKENLEALVVVAEEAFKNEDYHGAINIWERVTSAAVDSPSNPTSRTILLCTWDNLASAYSYVGNSKREIEALTACLTIIEKSFGKVHPQYIRLLCRLAKAKENTGEFHEMKSTLLEALGVVEKQRRSSKTEIRESKVLLLLSRAHQNLHESDEQLKMAEKGKKLISRHFNEKHRFSTAASIVLAKALGDSGRINEQLMLAQNVYHTHESQMGSFHSELADAAMEVAAAYNALGNFKMEENFLNEALEIQRKAVNLFPRWEVVETKIRIGDSSIKADPSENRWSLALSYYRSAIDDAQKHLVSNCPSLSRAHLRISQCYRRLEGENSEKSAQFLREAEQICEASGVASTHICVRELLAEKKLREPSTST